jgi:putative hydrolase of the HAD superfamily
VVKQACKLAPDLFPLSSFIFSLFKHYNARAMPIRAITFDLDDTLWPVAPVIERAERAMHAWLETHCPEVTARYDVPALRALRQRIGQEEPHLAHDFSALRRRSLEAALHGHGYDGVHVEGAFQAFYAERQKVDLFDDALPVLDRLRHSYLLGSVSNGNADLAVIGLDHFFPVRIHARQLGHAKPSREIYLAACQALGCEPGEVLHVGDDPLLDVIGARDAGLQVAWLDRHGGGWQRNEPAPPSLRRLDELSALVN